MLSKEAIDRLVEIVEQARGPHPLEGSLSVIPANARIEDTERAQPFRNRYRGKFTTGSMSAFIAYVIARLAARGDGPPVKVFVSHDMLRAEAIFNLGSEHNPGHGDDVAVLQLEKTPEYEAFCQFSGGFTQQGFVDWIRDWNHMARFGTVTTTDDGVETVNRVLAHQAVAAIRSVQVKQTTDSSHEVGDMATKRTRLEEIEAYSRTHALPTLISCSFVPAEGLLHRTADLRVSLASVEKPTFIVRPVAVAALHEEIAKDFEASLGAGLASAGAAGVEIFRGTFSP